MISIDHKWRDLPGNVYLGELLENYGHKIKYVRNGLEKYYIADFKPDLLVLIHLYEKKRQKFVEELSSLGIKIALLPTEGIPTLPQYRPFAAGANCDLTNVDIHFAWNEPMAKLIQKNHTISKDRIHVVGVNRFDFYHKPLIKLLVSKKEFCEKHNFDYSHPIITFATNFTQASFYKKQSDFLEKDARNLGYKDIMDTMHGGPLEIARKDYESRELLITSFIKLVHKYRNINFILKLHPSEDHEYYSHKLRTILNEDFNRVAIISTGYIWDVLNITDILLKRSCTTGVEAWLLGLPTIEMKLNPEEWYFSNEHAAGSDIATSYDELEKYIDYYLKGGVIKHEMVNARENFITKWCYRNDANSTKRIAEILHNFIDDASGRKADVKFNIKEYLFNKLLSIGDYSVHDIRVYGIRNMINGYYIDKLGREDKYIHNKDIRVWKKKLSSILG